MDGPRKAFVGGDRNIKSCPFEAANRRCRVVGRGKREAWSVVVFITRRTIKREPVDGEINSNVNASARFETFRNVRDARISLKISRRVIGARTSYFRRIQRSPYATFFVSCTVFADVIFVFRTAASDDFTSIFS